MHELCPLLGAERWGQALGGCCAYASATICILPAACNPYCTSLVTLWLILMS